MLAIYVLLFLLLTCFLNIHQSGSFFVVPTRTARIHQRRHRSSPHKRSAVLFLLRRDGSSANITLTYTGIERRWDWDDTGTSDAAEKRLLDSGVMFHQGEYGELSGSRREEVVQEAQRFGFTSEQVMILRHQMLAQDVAFRGTQRLARNLPQIRQKFETSMALRDLAYEYDLPPVSVIRAVIRERVEAAFPEWGEVKRRQLVTQVLRGNDTDYAILNTWEHDQLQWGKENDAVGYEPPSRSEFAKQWESEIYAYLDRHEVNYISENTMQKAGCKISPDCLILDDLFINGRRVRWIDFKSTYASGKAKLFTKKLKKQARKYETGLGERGAIIFKHGFSERTATSLPETLMLNAGPVDIGIEQEC